MIKLEEGSTTGLDSPLKNSVRGGGKQHHSMGRDLVIQGNQKKMSCAVLVKTATIPFVELGSIKSSTAKDVDKALTC
ncbi:MAG: hypothetical protein U0930_21495 [Pirellulales bacterium]